ncbi:MAG: cadherin-like beta sandwich domain-containing protein, partial [Pseudomonadota bacterium]
MILRGTLYAFATLLAIIAGLLVYALTVAPADLHDFESGDFYKTSAVQTDPGDTGLLVSLDYEQSLGADLVGETGLVTHVYPNFFPEIRRYAWYPYRSDDTLSVTPNWSADVARVSVNGEPHDLAAPITLSAADHGTEVSITASTADGARTANYVILTLPYNFPPLKTRITDPLQVSPGMITGVQASPNNPTYARTKLIRSLLYTQGLSGTFAMLRKTRKQPYDDFINPPFKETLDLESREYLPFVNFVL